MTEPEEDFDKGVDYTGVEDEEILSPRELGYSGDEDFTPSDISEVAADVANFNPGPVEDDVEDTHSPEDDGVETEANDG